MIELSTSDSSTIRNPSKSDLEKALTELRVNKYEFIILSVDDSSFIQVTCNDRLFSIEYRISDDEVVRIKKPFDLNEATELIEAFRTRNFAPVLSINSKTNLNPQKTQNDRHLEWRDKRNSAKLAVVNSLFRLSKSIVPLQIVICLILVTDLYVFEGGEKDYSVVSMNTEFSNLGFTRGLRVIAPNYARTYYVIRGRSGPDFISVSVSRKFGENVAIGKQVKVSSTKLFGLMKGVSYTLNDGSIIRDYRKRNRIFIFILAITAIGIVIKKYGRELNSKDYGDVKFSSFYYDDRSITKYSPIVYLTSILFLWLLLM